jgi:hypothetical protein
MDDGRDEPEELLDDTAAARLLEVTTDRLDVMVADGMLVPVRDSPRSFRRVEVQALRLSGG